MRLDLVLLLLVLCAPLVSAHLLASMPSWAKGPTYRGSCKQWKAWAVTQGKRNRNTMAAANASSRPYDLILYGDSITYIIGLNGKAQWNQTFPPDQWHTAAMGVAGTDIQDLVWRILSGWEWPAKPPRVVALEIGVNNVFEHTTMSAFHTRLDWLLSWFQAAFPETKLILMALLPTANKVAEHGRVIQAWNQNVYKPLASQHRITYLDCGAAVGSPHDTAVLYDGTHPAQAGIQRILGCLGPAVKRALAS